MAKRIMVEMDDWKPAERGDLLETDGVDACIAVALSNLQNGKGYMGHFSPDATNVDEMLERAKREATHPGYVNLWYGGAALVPPRTRDSGVLNAETRAFRIKMSRLLLSKGFRPRNTLWLRPGQWLTARLIAGTERCELVTERGRY